MSRTNWTHRKRKAAAPEEPAWDAGIELVDLREQVNALEGELRPLHAAFQHAGIADTRISAERRRLAEHLYNGNYIDEMVMLREQNKELVVVLHDQLVNTSDETEHLLAARARAVDGVLLDLCRAQNKFLVPVLSAGMSILGEFNHVAREYHDSLAIYHRGAALSEKWVREFLEDARAWRPPATEPMIEGLSVTVFDNLSMKVDYSSYSSQGQTGYQLHMTNWLSTRVPQSLAPSMDARALCEPVGWNPRLPHAPPSPLTHAAMRSTRVRRSPQWHLSQGPLAAQIYALLLHG
jgi:hypothetical protein